MLIEFSSLRYYLEINGWIRVRHNPGRVKHLRLPNNIGIELELVLAFYRDLTEWNLGFTLVQVRASAFGASKMKSAKTRRGMTSAFGHGTPRPNVNTGKCHTGIHSRSRTRPNSSVSLSIFPRLNIRALSYRGPLTSNPSFDPETQLSPDFRADLSPCERTCTFTIITLSRNWLVSHYCLMDSHVHDSLNFYSAKKNLL